MNLLNELVCAKNDVWMCCMHAVFMYVLMTANHIHQSFTNTSSNLLIDVILLDILAWWVGGRGVANQWWLPVKPSAFASVHSTPTRPPLRPKATRVPVRLHGGPSEVGVCQAVLGMMTTVLYLTPTHGTGGDHRHAQHRGTWGAAHHFNAFRTGKHILFNANTISRESSNCVWRRAVTSRAPLPGPHYISDDH